MKTDIKTKYEYIKQFLLLFMLVLHFYFAVLCNISILEQHLFKTKKGAFFQHSFFSHKENQLGDTITAIKNPTKNISIV